MGRVDGKTVMITGASRGIGAAAARLLVREGANVVVCDVRDGQGEIIADELGESALYAHLDVSDEGEWGAVVADARARFGKLDALVNNAAAPNDYRGILDSALADYQRMVAVNQTGVWLGIRSVTPALSAAGGGSIVNISSAAGMGASAGSAAYGVTKWAVRGMTKIAALDLAPLGIRVNSVHPGLIVTERTTEAGFPVDTPVSPLRRVGVPDDIASLILFLASDESAFCTGSEFVADGGFLLSPGSPPPSAVSA
jgi:3alpha(or 20beta)-hydroxysteroid dehydrogenase